MLSFPQSQLLNTVDRLETADARVTGQMEALTVWVAALVKTHPDGAALRATAQSLCARNPFRALCQYQEEVAAYDATYCQLHALALPAESSSVVAPSAGNGRPPA